MRAWLVPLLLCGLTSVLLAQHEHHVTPHSSDEEEHIGYVDRALLERPVPLRDGIGEVYDPVTTTNPDAQKFYSQGEAYLHSYVWIEAARSFNQALRLDPRLAMAYVGLSRAYTGLDDPEAARAALQKALALKATVTPREQRRIELRNTQLQALAAITDRYKFLEYKDEIDAALNKDPNDPELWLLRGNAEEPNASGRGQRGGAASIAFYLQAIAVSPRDNFAARHYLVHSYEVIGRNDLAVQEGEIYARMASSIPHAHHMYGHDLRLVGRIQDAIAEFNKADALERAYYAAEKIPPDADWHRPHNLDLLGRAYQHEGQMVLAEKTLLEAFHLKPADSYGEGFRRGMPDFLLARGRSREALAIAQELIQSPWASGQAYGHILSGHAYIDLNRVDDAQHELALALDAVKNVPHFSETVPSDLQLTFTPLTDELNAEIQLARGNRANAEKQFLSVIEEASKHRGADALGELYLIERIARVARDHQDYAFCQKAAEAMIAFDPAYAGGHYLRGFAAGQQGDLQTARAELLKARELWQSADPDLYEMGQVRQRLAAMHVE